MMPDMVDIEVNPDFKPGDSVVDKAQFAAAKKAGKKAAAKAALAASGADAVMVDGTFFTDDEMPAVIRSIDRDLRAQRPGLADHFAPLDDDVLSRLTSTAPRALYQTLKRAYSLAASQDMGTEGVIRLRPEHLGIQPRRREAGTPRSPQVQPSPDQLASYVARQALFELGLTLWDPGKQPPH